MGPGTSTTQHRPIFFVDTLRILAGLQLLRGKVCFGSLDASSLRAVTQCVRQRSDAYKWKTWPQFNPRCMNKLQEMPSMMKLFLLQGKLRVSNSNRLMEVFKMDRLLIFACRASWPLLRGEAMLPLTLCR